MENGENGALDDWQGRIHPEDKQQALKEVYNALDAAVSSFDIQYRVRHHNGHWVWVWDRGRIVRDRQGIATRIVGHIADITAQKNAEEALKEADQRKDKFLATLSHELRNPLAPIRNALNVMRLRGFSTPELQDGWNMIDRQVSHMARLIDDLLDITRISLNRMDLRCRRMDLAEAIRAAVEASAPLFEQLQHRLALSVGPAVYVHGDLVRLTQVFTNLLNNGAKYTPRGGQVDLTLETVKDDAVVRIKDTGQGISLQDLPRIFQMFYQDANPRPYSHDGLGIGLSLVARIAELHGGSVEAFSGGLNEGSEFVVRIPLMKDPDSAEEEPEPVFAPGSALSAHRILVADDNADSAGSLAMLLELQGYDVRTASDGLEAVQIASQFVPDAILLDIGMPSRNGYDAAQRIREQPWGKDILLIAQTGWGQERDRQRSRDAGFDAHLTKPLDFVVLMKLLGSPTELSVPPRNFE
jgi:signal transduction histidine kinase/CheY-like chemotaxis protein